MTDLAHLLQAERSRHAAAAAHERDERARLYPPRIRAGKIGEEEAHKDWHAWTEIAAWCAGAPMTLLGVAVEWPDLVAAAARALAACEAAVAKTPHDPPRRARRDAVARLHALLAEHAAWLAALNAAARARPPARIAA